MASSGDRFVRAAATRTKVEDVLKFKDTGLSVEEAKKAMIQAGEAPRGIVSRVATPAASTAVLTSGTEETFESELPASGDTELPAAATPTATTPVITPTTVPVKVVPEPQRIETDKFVGEIRQEGGKWVAELTYKNGGGTERWVANKKNELLLELLKGKGHATLRVKEAVRREKLNTGAELDKYYLLPEGVTAAEFEKLPESSQHAMLLQVAENQVMQFREAHPEFYKSPKNAEKINSYLSNRNLPITVKNLEFAYQDLLESEELETRPEARVAATPTPTPVPTPVATVTLEPSTPPAQPVPSAPTPAATITASAGTDGLPPGAVVRKRGSTGLQPGHSSTPSELAARPEDGGEQREPSEAELRKMSPAGQPVNPRLKEMARASRIANALRR